MRCIRDSSAKAIIRRDLRSRQRRFRREHWSRSKLSRLRQSSISGNQPDGFLLKDVHAMKNDGYKADGQSVL